MAACLFEFLHNELPSRSAALLHGGSFKKCNFIVKKADLVRLFM